MEFRFSTNYEAFIGITPLYQSTLIVYFSAIPSYYVPAILYLKKLKRKTNQGFVLNTAFNFWGLFMLSDLVFVVLLAGIRSMRSEQ